jgi:hypothetical protein
MTLMADRSVGEGRRAYAEGALVRVRRVHLIAGAALIVAALAVAFAFDGSGGSPSAPTPVPASLPSGARRRGSTARQERIKSSYEGV